MKQILLICCLLWQSVYLFGQTTDKYYYGDVNHDGKLTIADVTMLINTMYLPEKVVVEDDAIVPAGPVESMRLIESVFFDQAGASANLVKSTVPANATLWNVEWISSNDAVVSVNVDGTITAKSDGGATIKAVKKSDQSVLSSSLVIVGDLKMYFGVIDYNGGELPIGNENTDGWYSIQDISKFDYVSIRNDVGARVVAKGSTKNIELSLRSTENQWFNHYLLIPKAITHYGITNNNSCDMRLLWNYDLYETPAIGYYDINGITYTKFLINEDFMRNWWPTITFVSFSFF